MGSAEASSTAGRRAIAEPVNVRPLYDSVLAPRLQALERERRPLKHAIFASALLAGLPLVLGFCGGTDVLALTLPQRAQPWIVPALILWFIGGAAIAISHYALPGFTAYFNYRARFKREIVAEIFQAVSPGATYEPFSFIKPELFDHSGLFDTTGSVRGDDLVRGRIGETPFVACEIDRHYETGGENSQTVHVFHGLFFCLDFNKAIRGRTIVQPQHPTGIRPASHRDLAPVSLENPDFESRFEVFSTSPVEARYILTPLLMERIVQIHEKTGRPLSLAFVDNCAFVAVHYGRPLFEPAIRDTTSFEALAEMADHFRLAELVVRELDLNTRIWTKEVDAHLLEMKPAVDPTAALSDGSLTQENLLKRAAGELFVDSDSGPTPQLPARSRASIERYSDQAIIRYRFAWWAVICLIVSAWFAAVAAAAIAMIVAPEWTILQLRPFAGDLDVPLDALDLFREGALIVLGGAAVVGGFFALYWITYVRRVVITRGEIRVTRGLSPIPHLYPRCADWRILQMDNYLYLGRAGAFKIINPSLSPMLRSKAEARWVAWQMRRALEEMRA